jgi:hypothetical protein
VLGETETEKEGGGDKGVEGGADVFPPPPHEVMNTTRKEIIPTEDISPRIAIPSS